MDHKSKAFVMRYALLQSIWSAADTCIHIWIEFLTLFGPDSLYRWAQPKSGKAFPAFRSHCPFLSLSFPQPVQFRGTKLLGTFQKLFWWTLIVVIVVVVVETFQRFLLHCYVAHIAHQDCSGVLSLCYTKLPSRLNNELHIKLFILNIILFTTIAS